MNSNMKKSVIALMAVMSACSVAIAAPKKSAPKKNQTAATAPAKKQAPAKATAPKKAEEPKAKHLSPENIALLESGTPEEIIAAVNSGTISLTDKGEHDRSVLMYAANRNPNPNVITALVKAGADVNYKNRFGNSALSLVISHREAEFVDALIAEGANIDERVSSCAMGNPDIEIVKKFLKPEQLNEDSPDNSFYKAMLTNTNLDAIKLLIASGADVNFRDSRRGFTPIIWAARSERSPVETIGLLLENGADINAHTNIDDSLLEESGYTALHMAVRYDNRTEKIEYLLQKGAEVDARGDDGRTPLMLAATVESSNTPEILKILIAHGADVNTFDKNGNTAAHIAARMSAQNPEVISILLDAGAEVDARNGDGRTPLMLAAYRSFSNDPGIPEILKILIAHGADVNTFDKEGNTAALLAAKNAKNPEVISILLDAGADFTVPDRDLTNVSTAGKTAVKNALDNEAIQGTPVFWKLNDLYWKLRNRL